MLKAYKSENSQKVICLCYVFILHHLNIVCCPQKIHPCEFQKKNIFAINNYLSEKFHKNSTNHFDFVGENLKISDAFPNKFKTLVSFFSNTNKWN
jgi:hypothetical protein